MRISLICSVLIVILSCGCSVLPKMAPFSVSADLEITPPDKYDVISGANKDIVFDEAWARLMEGLIERSFEMESIEREAGIIVFRFETEAPEQFVDCGRALRTFLKDGVEEVFDYPISASSDYRTGYHEGRSASIQDIKRRTRLEGTGIITVEPDGGGVQASILVEYEIFFNATGDFELYTPERSYRGVTDTHTASIILSSQEPGRWTGSAQGLPAEIICRCNGNLERSILSLLDE